MHIARNVEKRLVKYFRLLYGWSPVRDSIMRIHLDTAMARKLHPQFLAYAGVGQSRVERVPQRMKTQGGDPPADPFFPLSNRPGIDPCALHQSTEGHRQTRFAATGFAEERRK